MLLKNVNNSLAENIRQSLVDKNAKQQLNEVKKKATRAPLSVLF